MNSILDEKKQLRSAITKQRDALDAAFKKEYDSWICTQLEQHIADKNCKVVHAYLPMGNEIDIKPLLEKLLSNSITVVVPKTLRQRKLQHLVLRSLNELASGIFGTSHPENTTEYLGTYDLIIVPGLAFDTNNYRLGYGGGYYDAFLAEHPNAFTVGICCPFQKVTQVPKETHDVCLDGVLSKNLV